MTTILDVPATEAYSLTEALQEPLRSESVTLPDPDEVGFEDLLLQKLGPRGWGRVCHFRQYYGLGWGEGGGKPLSPRAVEAFRRFLQDAHFPEGRWPSVFLTDGGGLELCWEDGNGKAIQVEFNSKGIEYYHEAANQEAATGFDGIPVLARRLGRA